MASVTVERKRLAKGKLEKWSTMTTQSSPLAENKSTPTLCMGWRECVSNAGSSFGLLSKCSRQASQAEVICLIEFLIPGQ